MELQNWENCIKTECHTLHSIEAGHTVLYLSWHKSERRVIVQKKLIKLDYLDSYHFPSYVAPSNELFFTPYCDPAPTS